MTGQITMTTLYHAGTDVFGKDIFRSASYKMNPNAADEDIKELGEAFGQLCGWSHYDTRHTLDRML